MIARYAGIAILIASGALAGSLTYRDIQPVLARRCQSCHQAGEIGPMPLTSYQEVRPWAKAIRQAVVQRTMPPWHADRETSVHIANSRMLPDSEVRLISEWVEAGAPEGAPLARSVPAREPDGWKLGKPDLVIPVPGFQVPAKGVVEYTFLVTPLHLTEDRWIAAAEWKVDQRAVVHHMNAFVRPPGSSYIKSAPVGRFYVASKSERGARREDEAEVDRRELLLGYEPGYRPAPWGEGRAKLIRKGSDLVFEIHYNPNGTALTDHSELGIYFAKEPPRERVLSLAPGDSKLAIPPGDGNYRSAITATFTTPVKLISLQPHMHLRGKSYEIRARFPDGRTESLLRVPRYDFNWQTIYFLSEPLDLPKGTVLDCVAHFDNSANNKFNPNPSEAVYWGDQSWQEMNIGFLEVAFPASADANVAILSDTTKPSPGAALNR
jgi:hypothetical protein